MRRYVEPTGKSGAEALDEIIRERGLEKILREPVDAEFAVFPDEHSKKKDDHDPALEEIRSNTGDKSMNRLVAAVCSILYDDNNGPDPHDVRKYTHKKLAKRFAGFGVKNERSARAHIDRGKELRAARKRNL